MQKISRVYDLPANTCVHWHSVADLLYKIMKISVIQITVAMIFCSMAIANDNYGQEVLKREVSLTIHSVTLEKALAEIENVTKVKFVYSSDRLILDRIVSVDVSKKQLGLVLDDLLPPSDIQYSVRDENEFILLMPRQPVETTTSPIGNTEEMPALVSGTVTDAASQAMPGVNVIVKGTTIGTTTDANGKYTVDASENDILVFSFIGYNTEEIRVGSQTVIDVALTMNIQTLSEVVVTGYGTTNRRDLTGSVSSVSPKEVSDVPLVSLDNAIAGKAAGVEVTKADGSPGGAVRIKIRGGTSLSGGNEPLYVIDGVPMNITNNYIQGAEVVNPVESNNFGEGFNNAQSGSFTRGINNLAGLNINDIESIDILKDASATAIYGSRAANGVVMITTKKGAYDSKPQLDAHVFTGVTHSLRPELLNADQYKMIITEAAQNSKDARTAMGSPTPAAVRAILENPDFFASGDTDWMNEVLRTGITYNADLSVRGGGKGSRYYTSLSYMKQTGTVIGTDFSRIAGKIRLDNDLSSKLRFSINLDVGVTENNLSSGVYGQALLAPPTFEPYQEDGSFTSFSSVGAVSGGYQNPLAVATATNKGVNYLVLGSLSAEYDVIKNLTWRSTVSTNMNIYNQRNYLPSYVMIGTFFGNTNSGGGVGSQANRQTRFLFFENTLTWNKQFNERHNLNVVAGTSWQTDRMDFFIAEGKNYPNDKSLNNLSSAAQATTVRGANPATTNSLLSFYARANYSLLDKYLFTFTGRSDASSKFAQANQVGFFPSGAVAWRISEESFLQNVSFLDDLKLRASIGLTGTQDIGSNQWRTLFTPESYSGSNAFVPTQLGNEKIKWEQTLQKDIGLDFSLGKGRVNGTVGYYLKDTDGLLLTLNVAPSSSYETLVQNIANIQNKGLEIELRGDILRAGNFRWNMAFNVARNRSLVTKVKGGEASVNLGTAIVKEDEPIGLMYGVVVEDMIRTQEQGLAYKTEYLYWPYLNRGLALNDGLGQYQFELDSATGYLPKRGIIGYAAPDFYGGITNTFSFKNFNLSMLFTYSKGNHIIYMSDVSNSAVTNLSNKSSLILDRWTPENPDAERPRLIYGEYVPLTNRNVYDASYIKLRTLSLSYNLSEILKSRAASVYFSATNLFTITNYPGLDPEVSDNPYSLIGGSRDVDSYPTNKSYTIGVRFGF